MQRYGGMRVGWYSRKTFTGSSCIGESSCANKNSTQTIYHPTVSIGWSQFELHWKVQAITDHQTRPHIDYFLSVSQGDRKYQTHPLSLLTEAIGVGWMDVSKKDANFVNGHRNRNFLPTIDLDSQLVNN